MQKCLADFGIENYNQFQSCWSAYATQSMSANLIRSSMRAHDQWLMSGAVVARARGAVRA